MEEEVREILRAVVMTQPETAEGLGTRIANRFKGLGFDHDIPELRDQPARAANFDE